MTRRVRKVSFTSSALTDGALIMLSMAVAFVIRFVVLEHRTPYTSLANHVLAAIAVSPVFVFVYSLLGVYSANSVNDTVKTLGRVTLGNTLGVMFFTDIVFFFRIIDFSRLLLILFWLSTNLLVGTKAILLDRMLGEQQERGHNQRQVLLVGSGAGAKAYLKAIRKEEPPSFHVLGTVGPAPLGESLPHLGDYQNIVQVIDQTTPEEIVIALEADENDQLDDILPACSGSGVKVMLLPPYHEYLSSATRMVSAANMPLISVTSTQLDNVGYAFAKRAFDFVGALVLIVLTSPIMLFAAIGTKLSSPGPIIFKQTRVGRGRRTFEMYKFRSMRVNTRQDSGWSVRDDPRRTRFGSFIRRYSIDELPQFFNVLKGDMSLVGPRPEVPKYVNDFKQSIPLYMVRHLVRPGITGWAQIKGYRGDTSIPKRIEHDLYYIEHWSMLFDLRILLETPFKGIVAEGETIAH